MIDRYKEFDQKYIDTARTFLRKEHLIESNFYVVNEEILRPLLRRVVLPRPGDKYYNDKHRHCLIATDNKGKLFFSTTNGRSLRFQTIDVLEAPTKSTRKSVLVNGKLLLDSVRNLSLSKGQYSKNKLLTIEFNSTKLGI